MGGLSSSDLLTGGSVISSILSSLTVVFWVFTAINYLFIAVCTVKIAQKTNTPDAWIGWIPIVNFILMIKIAQKPIWWFVMIFIPFVSIIFKVLVFMEVAKRLGKPDWWGILTALPLVDLVIIGLMAFSKNEVVSSSFLQPKNDQNDINRIQ